MKTITKKEKREFMIEGTENDPKFEMRDIDIDYLVYDLACSDCGEKGGEITFEKSKVKDEAALEAHLDSEVSHICHTCCCEGRNDASHENYGKACKANIHA